MAKTVFLVDNLIFDIYIRLKPIVGLMQPFCQEVTGQWVFGFYWCQVKNVPKLSPCAAIRLCNLFFFLLLFYTCQQLLNETHKEEFQKKIHFS